MKIGDPQHYIEFAKSLSAAVSAARELVAETDIPELPDHDDDPRAFMTSAGVLFLYTLTWEEEEKEYWHLFCVSRIDTPLKQAIAENFIIYTARLLSINIRRLQIQLADDETHDVIFVLSPAEQRRLDKRTIPIYSIEYLHQFHKDVRNLRRRLQDQYVPDEI